MNTITQLSNNTMNEKAKKTLLKRILIQNINVYIEKLTCSDENELISKQLEINVIQAKITELQSQQHDILIKI